MKRFLFLLALGVAGAWLVRSYGFEGIYLATNSMAPTLPEGTHILVNKWVYLFRGPRRGEIVMFESPIGNGKGMVKRVIAVAGDDVEIRRKIVYLNGAKLEEPYVQFLRPDVLFVGDNLAPLRVPENHVFVLGDNRDVSGDSRDWKKADGERIPFVPVSTIEGLVKTK